MHGTGLAGLGLLRLYTKRAPERVVKSPAELMTGKQHTHGLELLGFERFRRSPVRA